MFFLQALPEGCLKQDKNGMIPLHHACASGAPNFHQYITALLDVHSGEYLEPDFLEKQLSVLDHYGRTPLQLLPDNGTFLLHEWAANSIWLSERMLHLLVNIFPNSITTPNKYGMLPCHCACLKSKLSIDMVMLFISISLEVVVPVQICLDPFQCFDGGKPWKAKTALE